jgi:hypothetical protein
VRPADGAEPHAAEDAAGGEDTFYPMGGMGTSANRRRKRRRARSRYFLDDTPWNEDEAVNPPVIY